MPRIPKYETDVTLKVTRDERLVDNTAWWPIMALAGLGVIFLVFALWTHFNFLSGEIRVVEKIVDHPVYVPAPIEPTLPAQSQDVRVHGAVDLNLHTPQLISCEQECRLKNPQAIDYCIDSRCR